MSRRRPFIFPSLLAISVLVCLPSCTELKPERKGAIEIGGEVTVVKNPIEPLYPEMRIQFEEDLTIGIEEGDENYMLGNLVLLNTDDKGNFYVTEGDRQIVNKYDASGRFLQSIGRPGQGPGEFQDISVVRFDASGNIYLTDTKSQQISVLSRDGRYLKAVKIPPAFDQVAINSRGFYIARSVDNVELGNGKKWDYFYGMFDEDFNLLEEFLRLPQEADKGKGSPLQATADYLSGIAFQPTVSYALSRNDLLYFGYPETYEIKVYSSEGKLEKTIQREFEPSEISGQDREHFQKEQSERFRSKMSAGAENKIFGLVNYPQYKPAYEKFVLMENGWIFVVVDSLPEDAKLIDIFDKDGEYLAQFETDIATDWLSFNNGKAYAVATIDDYRFIKRYDFEIRGYDENDP